MDSINKQLLGTVHSAVVSPEDPRAGSRSGSPADAQRTLGVLAEMQGSRGNRERGEM
jgi:hypothetical protein